MKESSLSAQTLRFGVLEFDPRAGELRKQGMKIRLQGQPIDILAMLLERPGEAVTPPEAFLTGVAACGVELLQVIAREMSLPIPSARVHIEGTIDRDHPVRPDVTLFNEVRLHFSVGGVTREQATDLVERFKKR